MQSLPHLKGAVAFSEYAGDWLRERLGVPVLVVKHPTEMVPRTFSWEAFEANPDKQLVQIGWYLRNYRAIYQVAAPPSFRKVHIAQQKSFIERGAAAHRPALALPAPPGRGRDRGGLVARERRL